MNLTETDEQRPLGPAIKAHVILSAPYEDMLLRNRGCKRASFVDYTRMFRI